MTEKCSVHVPGSGGWYRYHCSRAASLQENGRWFCKQHAPSTEAARKAKWKAEMEWREAGYSVGHAERSIVEYALLPDLTLEKIRELAATYNSLVAKRDELRKKWEEIK